MTLHTKRHSGRQCLFHFEEFATRLDGMRREKELKTGKGLEWIRRVLMHGG